MALSGAVSAMRILVIGSTGQVARALAVRGAAAGHDIVCVGRPQIDLERPTGLADLFSGVTPDIVINAAAYTAVDRAEDEAERADAINNTGAVALARSAEALDLPFIQISTDYVFDGLKGAPYLEADTITPVNVYGRTKAMGEAGVLAVHPKALVVRTSWVYAADGTNFVRTMLRLAADRDRLNVVNDQIGRPTEAEALAEALLSLSQSLRSGAEGGLLHVANDGEASWRDFAEAAIRGAGLKTHVEGIPTSDYPTPAPRPRDTRLDLTKAQRDYDVRLPDWRESLERCLTRMDASGRGA